MTKKLYAFLAGIGSILVIQPTINTRVVKMPNAGKSHQEILAQDFQKIGLDLKSSTLKSIKSYYAKENS